MDKTNMMHSSNKVHDKITEMLYHLSYLNRKRISIKEKDGNMVMIVNMVQSISLSVFHKRLDFTVWKLRFQERLLYIWRREK